VAGIGVSGNRGLDAAEGDCHADLVGEVEVVACARIASMRSRRRGFWPLPGEASVAEVAGDVGDQAAVGQKVVDVVGHELAAAKPDCRAFPYGRRAISWMPALAGATSAPRMSFLGAEVVVERGLCEAESGRQPVAVAALEAVL